MIRAALARGMRNLGIDCGKSGYLVIDEDTPGAFDRYAQSIGATVPVTFTVTTAKGRHVYFLQPPGPPLGNGTGALSGRGIDVRGHGGYVVGPGSVHQTGVLYAPMEVSTAIVPAPSWLVSALHAAPAERTRPGLARHGGSAEGRLRGAVAAVLDAQRGERNNLLHWASCRAAEMIAAGHLDRVTAINALTEAGEAVGLGAGEVQATIASALRAAAP